MSGDLSERNPLDVLAEEFVARYRRGERPPLTEYVQRLPEMADKIQELFPALVMMERVKSDGDGQLKGGASAVAEPPVRLGEYRILREIGRGGMGVVYEAVQESLGRHVALKILPPLGALDSLRRKRFRHEAQAAARLHHTNIVPVFGVGQHDNVFFYVMQFINGQTIEDVLREVIRLRQMSSIPRRESEELTNRLETSACDHQSSKLAGYLFAGDVCDENGLRDSNTGERAPSKPVVSPPLARPRKSMGPEPTDSQKSKTFADSSAASSGDLDFSSGSDTHYFRSVARVGVQVSNALAYAHSQGVVHRDIKPSNLLLDVGGTVWVADFGLAKDETADLTHSGDVVGTMRYLAPERFGGCSGPRSDVYALGMTLYEMLTLRPAFDTADRGRLIRQITDEHPEPPSQVDRHVPKDLETIVLKAMEKEPMRRYQSANEMADDLRRYLASEPIHARRITSAGRVWKWCKRNPRVALLTTVAVSLLVFLAIAGPMMAINQSNARRNAEVARQNAEEARERTRRLLYVSNMNAAMQAWEALDITRMLQLLNQHRPDSGEEDLRGFEWYYLWRLCDRSLRGPHIQHQHPVDAVAYSPDGSSIVTGSGTKLQVWNPNTRERQFALSGHEGSISHVAFSPNGQLLACGDDGGIVNLWDFAERRIRHALPHSGRITAIAFSHDGSILAVANRERSLGLWDVMSGKKIQEAVVGQQFSPFSIAFSPHGQLLATADYGGKITIWNLTLHPQYDFEAHEGHVNWIGFSRDGDTLFSAGNESSLRYWDMASRSQMGRLKGHTAAILSASLSPDQKTLVTASVDSTVRLWDVESEEELKVYRGHVAGVASVKFSPSGDRIVSGGKDSVLRFWSIAGESETSFRVGPKLVRRVVLSPDAKTLAAVAWGEIRLCNMSTGTVAFKDLKGYSADFSPNGKTLVTAEDRTGPGIKFWDVDTKKMIGSLDGSAYAFYAVYSSDGKHLATAHSWDESAGTSVVKLWKADPWRQVNRFPTRWFRSMAFSPSGNIVAFPAEGKVVLYHVAEQRTELLSDPDSQVYSVAFSPNGELLAMGAYDSTIRLLNMKSGQTTTLYGHLAEVEWVAFAPDGKTLASAGNDSKIKLWNLDTNELAVTLSCNAPVLSLDFSRDASLLVAGQMNAAATVSVWRAATNEQAAAASTIEYLKLARPSATNK